MAQVLRIKSSSDKRYMIPSSLTHSAGTIFASFPTNTMVGGSYSVALSGLVAHSTYFLYLKNSGISPALFFSTTTPAAYRVTFTDAILVGAFIANETPAFGSFINIEGVPRTQTNFTYTPSGASGFGTFASPNMNCSRDGRFLICDFRFGTGSVVAAVAYITLPGSLIFDTAAYPQTSYFLGTMLNNSAVGLSQMYIAPGSNQDRIFLCSQFNLGTALNGSSSPFVNGQIESGQYRLVISGWSDTPLKDL